MKCCLCDKEIEPIMIDGKVIWDSGNNALPVKDGRCCNKCNMEKVIKKRLKILRGKM